MFETDAKFIGRTDNSLLAQLPDEEWRRIYPQLQVVELETRAILYERYQTLDYVYFPRRGCVSLVIDFADGFQAEAGLIGYEGMVGVPLIYGVKTDIVAAVVQSPTEALRMPAGVFSRQLGGLPALKEALARYGEGMRTQAMQLAACNGHHGLDERLARCILTLQDRHRGLELPVTHELFAALLCAHRPSVSVVAKRLQQAGLIRYAAGQLMVADRPGLERVACECYRVIRDHLELIGQA